MLFKLLSVQGRADRMQFVRGIALTLLAVYALAHVLHWGAVSYGRSYNHWFVVAWGTVQILAVYRLYVLMRRRANDAGKPGAWVVMSLGALVVAYYLQREPLLAQALVGFSGLVFLALVLLRSKPPANEFWDSVSRTPVERKPEPAPPPQPLYQGI